MVLLSPARLCADPAACLAAPSRPCLIALLQPALPAAPPPGVVPPDMAALVQALLTARAREGEAIGTLAPIWGADTITRSRAEALGAAGDAVALAALAALADELWAAGRRAVALELLAQAPTPEARRLALLAMAGGVNDMSRNLPLTLALAEGIAERSRFLMRVAEAQTPEWEVQLQIAFPLPSSPERDRLVTAVVGLLAAEDAARAVALVQSGIRDPGRRNAALALIAARMP